MLDIEKIKPNIKQLAEKYNLSLVILFGSRATGKTHPQSDIDLAFLAKRNLDLMDESKLICDLMLILGSDKIDLTNLKKTGPLLMRRIFSNHKILFCKDLTQYYQYKIYSMKKYIEDRSLFDLTRRQVKRFLEKYA
jgi:predicted nucleotidyltransferase